MFSLPEYRATAADIKTLGQTFDDQMRNALPDLDQKSAIKLARDMANDYYEEVDTVIQEGLTEVGVNVAGALDLDTDEQYVEDIVKLSLAQKYFGLTYRARQTVNRVRLMRKITQTAAGGKDKLAGIYTERYPYGAQVNTDIRTFQGYTIKLEQDLVKEAATKQDVPFVQWRLSPKHAKECMCDVLANNIDKEVQEFVIEHNLDLELEGLYFRDKLPRPPHPNCQCDFGLVEAQGAKRLGKVKRTARKIRNLVRRISSK